MSISLCENDTQDVAHLRFPARTRGQQKHDRGLREQLQRMRNASFGMKRKTEEEKVDVSDFKPTMNDLEVPPATPRTSYAESRVASLETVWLSDMVSSFIVVFGFRPKANPAGLSCQWFEESLGCVPVRSFHPVPASRSLKFSGRSDRHSLSCWAEYSQ